MIEMKHFYIFQIGIGTEKKKLLFILKGIVHMCILVVRLCILLMRFVVLHRLLALTTISLRARFNSILY